MSSILALCLAGEGTTENTRQNLLIDKSDKIRKTKKTTALLEAYVNNMPDIDR